jgi:hypothetical protein
MRLAAIVAAAVAVAALAPAVRAEDRPARITLEVGEVKVMGGSNARCDDLTVVTVTLDANATLTGLAPGRTLCSSARIELGGGRRVFEVVVTPKKP